jgi:phosphatidate cytidylyltransferase
MTPRIAGLGETLAAIVTVLLLASTVSFLLRRRVSPDGVERRDREPAGPDQRLVDHGRPAGPCLTGRADGVILVSAVCSLAALREFVTLMDTRRSDHRPLAAVFFVVLPAQYTLVATDWYGLHSILISVYAFLLIPIPAALAGDTEQFLSRVAEVQWALTVCVYCISRVPALLTLQIPGHEGCDVLLVAFLVIVVQGSDVL